MPSDLERKLLETDLDRLVALCTPEEVRLDCDQGGDECLVMIRERGYQRGNAVVKREYTIVRTADFETMKRELETFQRRFKELYG